MIIATPDGTKSASRGQLDSRWTTWFDGLGLTHGSDGTTISGLVADQATLQGLLQKVRDIGLPLVSVTQVDPVDQNCPPPHLDR